MIHVRELAAADAASYYRMVDRSRDGLDFPWVRDFTQERAEKLLGGASAALAKMTVYGIFLESLLVGSVEVRDHNIKKDGHEIGFFMDAQNRGRGHMKEAIPQVMSFHQDIFPFYADSREDNAPSLWLLWGLGFKEDYRWKPEPESAALVRLVYNKHIK